LPDQGVAQCVGAGQLLVRDAIDAEVLVEEEGRPAKARCYGLHRLWNRLCWLAEAEVLGGCHLALRPSMIKLDWDMALKTNGNVQNVLGAL
jgi:hypothetical protein